MGDKNFISLLEGRKWQDVQGKRKDDEDWEVLCSGCGAGFDSHHDWAFGWTREEYSNQFQEINEHKCAISS